MRHPTFFIEYNTKQEAEEAQPKDLFCPVGIFLAPNGKYGAARLRLYQYTDFELQGVAREIERISGHKLVSSSTALFGLVFQDYTPPVA